MNEENIRKYARLMTELGLTGLEITQDNTIVRLERSAAPAPAVQTIAVPSLAASSASGANGDGDTISVLSPMVGVFYAAPAENADPFVRVGDRICAGQTLCIIEAMKLMNEIPAECGGEVVEICVGNGQNVDYGCTLFNFRR